MSTKMIAIAGLLLVAACGAQGEDVEEEGSGSAAATSSSEEADEVWTGSAFGGPGATITIHKKTFGVYPSTFVSGGDTAVVNLLEVSSELLTGGDGNCSFNVVLKKTIAVTDTCGTFTGLYNRL